MTDKERYIDEQISKILQFWNQILLLLAIALFLLLGIMDYFMTPENFQTFGVYRLGVSSILAILLYLNRLKRNRNYQYFIITTMIILSGIVIELMILKLGGHRSNYYAGINLLIIGALGLIPFNMPLSISIAALIYAIYLGPILLFDKITDPAIFIANNAFMLSTFVITLTFRILTQKSTVNELSLQYDLAREKEKLEHLVLERTKALHRSEQWHKSIFENATDGIIILNQQGLITNANDKACTLHGFEKGALVGMHIKLIESEAAEQRLSSMLSRILEGGHFVFETLHNKKDGTPVWFEVSATAITIGDETYIQSFYRDVTEKRKLQEHLNQSQKLESIGVLAGGIAHDFNNVLTGILGYTEVIRAEGGENEKISRAVNIIESSARGAGRMIAQLLGFARRQAPEVLPFSLNDVVRDTATLLERVVDKTVEIRLDLEGAQPIVEGDVNQLEQVIMNLVVNAKDAMPDGGTITVKTEIVEARQGSRDVPPFIPQGMYARLSVKDTGVGIPREIRDKIFEPFFTTKERGKGTGLGLSMAYGVIRQHKGYITVDSVVKKGTTFSVYLPLSSKAPVTIKRASPASVQGSETILVVDDDEAVLSFIKDSLEKHGYKVLSARDPSSAIDIFKKQQHDISLVVSDVIMPLMSGRSLIREIKAINPNVKTLEISGYISPSEASGGRKGDDFLQKPFESLHLLSSIRRLLDTRTIDTSTKVAAV